MTERQIATLELDEGASVEDITDLIENGIEMNHRLEASCNFDGTYDIIKE